MANIKISELTESTNLQSTDVLVWDSGVQTFKITLGDLADVLKSNGIQGELIVSDYSSQLTFSSATRKSLYKYGRSVYLSVATGTPSINLSSGWNNLGSVPSACYPVVQVDTMVATADGKTFSARITTSGTIDVYAKEATTIDANYGLRLSVGYISAL